MQLDDHVRQSEGAIDAETAVRLRGDDDRGPVFNDWWGWLWLAVVIGIGFGLPLFNGLNGAG